MNGSMWCGPHPPASAAAAHTGVLILMGGGHFHLMEELPGCRSFFYATL